MKKQKLILTFLATLSCCLVLAGCEGKKTEGETKDNMFLDPNFENGGSAWSMHNDWSVIKVPSNAYAGNYVARYLHSSGSSNYRIWQEFKINEGQHIFFSAMVKCTSSPTKDMHWYIVFRDKDDNVLSHYSSPSIVSATWAESKGDATAPAGTVKVDVSLFIHSPEPGTTAYADNFVCTVLGPTAGSVAR
jgi:hypothetical protein